MIELIILTAALSLSVLGFFFFVHLIRSKENEKLMNNLKKFEDGVTKKAG